MSSPASLRLVLVVEDNLDTKALIVESLRRFEFDVMEAATLKEARALASARAPDVVLLDCRLPDGDGLELAREWAGEPAMRDVPVVVLSGFSARQDLEAALLAGADAFLVKPCAGAVIAAQLERVIDGGRPSQCLQVRERLRRP